MERIAPTIQYAIGQDNNHGSSEAAALFVGGSWLTSLTRDENATYWEQMGRRWLENRALVLIEKDGGGNQYSVAYHRTVLDTYAFTLIWCRHMNLQPFTEPVLRRLAKGAKWLFQMTDCATGDAPNLGANDGGCVFNLSDGYYRDFRSTVQIAMILFANVAAYPESGIFYLLLVVYNIEKLKYDFESSV